MYDITQSHVALQEARQRANLTQQDLAERVGTSLSAIAKLEQAGGNHTVDTLARCAAAAGFAISISLTPLPASDAVVERYKRDVDRTLVRENLRTSVDQRLRTLSEWQVAGRALQRATTKARRRS